MRQDAPTRLLAWYDAQGRVLPWRVADGTADPYRVWLSEVMLQQTTVTAVRPRFEAWVSRWPTVGALAAAAEADVLAAWAGLGYYARARNLHAAARAVVGAGGFPRDEVGLRALPGIGDYTAAAIAAIAFGAATVPVDANIARVGARLFAADLTSATLRPRLAALFGRERPGDVAQALMDIGSAICTPRAPACLGCPLSGECAAFASGDPTRWPARHVKAERPVRRGIAFWLQVTDRVLLVRRPPRGLLGGMMALPTSEWQADLDWDEALADVPTVARWRLLDTRVAHVFTHFRLDLGIAVGRLDFAPNCEGEWTPIAALAEAGLPTLFAKAAAMAMAGTNFAKPSPLQGGLGGGRQVALPDTIARHRTPTQTLPARGRA